MIKRTFEFDSFGPWILEINGKHRFPPLFKNYEPLQDEAYMFFKIPRKIERRNANPDMHLYDMVVGIFADYILILQRDINRVVEYKLALKDIIYFTQTECLLSGELIFITASKHVCINYNTVSHELISRFLRLIRNFQPKTALNTSFSPIDYTYNNIDILYYNLLKEMKKDEPANNLVAYQPNFTIPRKKTMLQILLAALTQSSSSVSTIFVANPYELIIIDRSSQYKGKKDTQYSYTFTYIPLDKIRKIFVDIHPEIPEINLLSVALQDYTFTFPTNSENRGITRLTTSLLPSP